MIGPTMPRPLRTAILLIAPVVLALAAPLSSISFTQPVSGSVGEGPCADARDAARDTLHRLSPTGTRAVRRRIETAFVLFRMGRTSDAKASIDSALTLLDLSRKRLMTSAEREGVRNAVDGLLKCVNTSTAPPLATLTVRTYEQDDRVADGKGASADPGALVRVDDLPVGRTGPGGIFTGPVPSGSLRVTVEIAPSTAGETHVNLSPGGAGEVSILLQSSKQVTEPTPLVVAEADGGIVPAAARTLTLKFVGSEGTVRIRQIDEIDLLGREGNSEQDLTKLFGIEDGSMVAVDAAKVIGMMRARSTGLVILSVQGSGRTMTHAGEVEFRIE